MASSGSSVGSTPNSNEEVPESCASHSAGNGGGELVRGAAVAAYYQGAEITKERRRGSGGWRDNVSE